MNLQEIKTQLDALNKAVTEIESEKPEYTFTKEQMERFVLHMTETLIEAIKSEIDHNWELDEDNINIDISSNYGRSFEIDLNIDQRELRRSIKDVIGSSYDGIGIVALATAVVVGMDEVDNCYPAIVNPTEPIVVTQD
jgi:hypothetical protein